MHKPICMRAVKGGAKRAASIAGTPIPLQGVTRKGAAMTILRKGFFMPPCKTRGAKRCETPSVKGRVGQDHVIIRINGVHTVFSAGKLPYIRSYTVYVWCFWQGNHHTYGHIRCVYTGQP